MNKAWYSKLSEIDKQIIEAACMEENGKQMAETNWNNGIFLDKLTNEHGVKLRKFSDEIYDAFGKASDEVFQEVIETNDITKRTYESFVAARTNVGRWMLLADTGYTEMRNRVLGISV